MHCATGASAGCEQGFARSPGSPCARAKSQKQLPLAPVFLSCMQGDKQCGLSQCSNPVSFPAVMPPALSSALRLRAHVCTRRRPRIKRMAPLSCSLCTEGTRQRSVTSPGTPMMTGWWPVWLRIIYCRCVVDLHGPTSPGGSGARAARLVQVQVHMLLALLHVIRPRGTWCRLAAKFFLTNPCSSHGRQEVDDPTSAKTAVRLRSVCIACLALH